MKTRCLSPNRMSQPPGWLPMNLMPQAVVATFRLRSVANLFAERNLKVAATIPGSWPVSRSNLEQGAYPAQVSRAEMATSSQGFGNKQDVPRFRSDHDGHGERRQKNGGQENTPFFPMFLSSIFLSSTSSTTLLMRIGSLILPMNRDLKVGRWAVGAVGGLKGLALD